MRCLSRLGANVVIQADANDGQWTGDRRSEQWQPLSLDGLRLPRGQRPERPLRLRCQPVHGRQPGGHAVRRPDRDPRSAGAVVAGCSLRRQPHVRPRPGPAASTGPTPAPSRSSWRSRRGSVPDGPRSSLRAVGAALAGGTGRYQYVQTAVIADLPFPVDRDRPRLRGRGAMSGGLAARGADRRGAAPPPATARRSRRAAAAALASPPRAVRRRWSCRRRARRPDRRHRPRRAPVTRSPCSRRATASAGAR